MKKQILIYAMFTLALIFAGMKSYGQARAVTYIKHVEGTPQCAPALPLTCATTFSHLNPNPGQIYNYSIATDPAAVDNVLWFVTDASAIITDAVVTTSRDLGDGTGNYVLTAETGVYNDATVPLNTQKDIDISWKWFDGSATEVLLVAYVQGAAGCTDNVEVWRIQPAFAFTLDVLSMASDGSLGTKAIPASECVSPVESANYDGTNMTMDYGENWVFFSVNAANFSDSWMPNMTAVLNPTVAGKTIGAVEWAYPAQANIVTGTWNATTVPVEAQVAGGAVGAAGECIVVRVEIQNGNIPTPLAAATENVTLSINGIMYNAVTADYTTQALRDVDEGTPTCVQDFTDTGNYTLKARPQITAVTPAPPSFEPKN